VSGPRNRKEERKGKVPFGSSPHSYARMGTLREEGRERGRKSFGNGALRSYTASVAMREQGKGGVEKRKEV